MLKEEGILYSNRGDGGAAGEGLYLYRPLCIFRGGFSSCLQSGNGVKGGREESLLRNSPKGTKGTCGAELCEFLVLL